jgi:nucleotide-binding universal stress UspA family protein
MTMDSDARSGMPLRQVLLATDLTPVSDAATEEAIRVAERDSAELLVLSVIEPARLRLPNGGGFGMRVDQERGRRERAVGRIVWAARDKGIRATFLIWEGDPAESIIAAAAAESADVIILGSHGRGRLGRMLLGSVSSQVAGTSSVPVLVVSASGRPERHRGHAIPVSRGVG